MSPLQSQLDLQDDQLTLRQRLRELGLVLLDCSEAGEVMARPRRGSDWLADLFCESPLFRRALAAAAARWADQPEPVPIEAAPGCWLAPILLTTRRRRTGYAVAVIPTGPLLEAEQLSAMCQAAGMDFRLCQQRLCELPPAGTADVPRLWAMIRLAHEQHSRAARDSQAMDSVGRQLAESYEEINLLYTIIQSMTVVEQPERFVTVVCEELLATLPYAWIAAQLADDREQLQRLAGHFVFAGTPTLAPGELNRKSQKLLAMVQTDTPLVVDPHNPGHAEFASLGQAVAVQPVSRGGKVIGILIAGAKQGPDCAVSSVDMKLLGATATHMGIFLENAALYDDLNAMFLGTLEAITASIDAKDRYTSGHSQRVAHLSQQLARAVGLDDSAVRRVQIAGLVHDVGKIGVPESVLCKPGRLTDEEFGLIRRHPEIGHRILKDIPQLTDVLPGVLHHHERWDGRGYPAGLAGEETPFIARLIALADAFDAMSSNRAYRTALSRRQVLDEIARCAGTQFDPELARVFITMNFTEFQQMLTEHRAADAEAQRRGDPNRDLPRLGTPRGEAA